jgi:outer membrane receptor protein involved in Fe transport
MNNQFADIDLVTRRAVGSNPYLVDRYHLKTNTVYYSQSVDAARLANDVNLLEPVPIKDFETEKISSFEIGYKSLLADKLLIDAYYYYSAYQDFIVNIFFKQYVPSGSVPDAGPTNALALVNDIGNANTQEYAFSVNAEGNIRSNGVALGLEYTLPVGFLIRGNVAYNELLDQQDLINQGFSSQYNTAEIRYNLGLDNRGLVDKFSFGINYRWQDSFFWESELGNAIIPAFGVVDMQMSYELHGLHSIVKLGGSNIFNKRYTNSFASPSFGAIYYVSLTFDEFFK